MTMSDEELYASAASDSPKTVRALSPALRAWALTRFAPKIRIWLLVVIGAANMIGGVMFLGAYLAGPAEPRAQVEASPQTEQARDALRDALRHPGLPDAERRRLSDALARLEPDDTATQAEASPEWLLWTGILWIAFDVGLLGGIVVIAKALGVRKSRQLLALLERGQVGAATILANQVDYSTRVNGSPRRIVALSIAGRPIKIRTFDNNFANLFPVGETIDVLYDWNIPKMVFPLSQVPAI